MPESWPQVEGAYRPRNGARTPMQWLKGTNLGFSTAQPSQLYLPVDPSPDAPTADAQEKDKHSLLNRTRRLIHLRNTEPALSAYAEFVPLYAKKETYPFVYCRANGNEVVLVILNPAREASSVEFSLDVPFSKLTLLAGKAPDISRKGEKLSVKIGGQSYAIYRVDR
jgi:glycosidase